VELRETFDTVAEQYERARPQYPGERILEIGCGTGQLTRALVARGRDVTCVESAAHLASVARRTAPGARIVVSRFEDWEPDGLYDAVCCATAWHWLDPGAATRKVHGLLRPGGVLALIGTLDYDAESYIDGLGTYSGHIAMTDDERATIFDGVRRLAPPGRTIRKHHLFCLHLATKVG
jgi:2-polyprenyl-3-methyl-5-hydroxy-6-metoxy-1,4-benzoquinol methylase